MLVNADNGQYHKKMESISNICLNTKFHIILINRAYFRAMGRK